MLNFRYSLQYLLFVLLSTVLIGCTTTQPTHFYLLTGMDNNPASLDSTNHIIDSTQHIGLGPIKLPTYLDRPAIVFRNADSEIIVDDTHRWAEPLEKNFTRVLADNLFMLLDKTSIETFPWRRSKTIDYQIIVNVMRFDANTDNEVVLSTHWTVLRKADNQELHSQKSIITQQAGNNSYATIVSTQSKVIEKLSREIATHLHEIVSQH